MAKDKNRLANRLAAIKSAKPVAWSAPPPLKKRQGRAERNDTYRFARLIYDTGETVNCILKDISQTGAKVMIEGNFTLPRKMTLKIDQAGVSKAVHIVWQDETIVGLAFLQTGGLRKRRRRPPLKGPRE